MTRTSGRRSCVAMAVEFDRLQQSATIDNFLAGTFQSATATKRSATPTSAGSAAMPRSRR